jgi:hypothetical protein
MTDSEFGISQEENNQLEVFQPIAPRFRHDRPGARNNFNHSPEVFPSRNSAAYAGISSLTTAARGRTSGESLNSHECMSASAALKRKSGG